MPRLVLLSDTHSFHREIDSIPEGDILIHAGDFTRKGSLSELADFIKWFSELPHSKKVFIAGNHDFCFEREQGAAKRLIGDVIYLQDTLCIIDGIKIYGSP